MLPTELSRLSGVAARMQGQTDISQDADALLTDMAIAAILDDSTTNMHGMMWFSLSGNSNHGSISVIGGESSGSSLYLVRVVLIAYFTQRSNVQGLRTRIWCIWSRKLTRLSVDY